MLAEQQFNISKLELELVQKQIDKHDDISTKIKAWAITLWAAMIGWSFQVKRKELLVLVIVALFLFWILDAINKNFRQGYRARRQEVSEAFQFYIKNSIWPESFISPEISKSYSYWGVVKNFFRPHLFLSYLSLIIISVYLLF